MPIWEVLILAGLAGGLAVGAYSMWRLVRRTRGRGAPGEHLRLRVIAAVASVAVFALGVTLAPVERSPSRVKRDQGTGIGNGSDGRTEAALLKIDSILEGLPLAKVAFNAPTSMTLGESAVIELLLSTHKPIEDLKQKVTEAGERVGAQSRISDRMKARLTGRAFKIHNIGEDVQAVSARELTHWRWEVEPIAGGRQRLHLTLSAFLDVGAHESMRTVRTFERTLTVDVSLGSQFAKFVGGNW